MIRAAIQVLMEAAEKMEILSAAGAEGGEAGGRNGDLGGGGRKGGSVVEAVAVGAAAAAEVATETVRGFGSHSPASESSRVDPNAASHNQTAVEVPEDVVGVVEKVARTAELQELNVEIVAAEAEAERRTTGSGCDVFDALERKLSQRNEGVQQVR